MKLLAAIDSFKGCATSEELNQAVLESVDHPLVTEKLNVPIADGGEGTLEALRAALDGVYRTFRVPDLKGNVIDVDYLVVENEGKTAAFIESAKVVGIDLIQPSEQTIQTTNSYGLGILVKKIIETGVNQIYISLGGSGTSDGGLGFLAGLGVEKIPINGINPLLTVDDFDISTACEAISECQIIALADVTNSYIGDNGFSMFFGYQKGGTKTLLQSMDMLAEKVVKQFDDSLDIANAPGSGAAGGLGGAILAIGGNIQQGFDTISQLISLEEKIAQADLVITGEGRLDEQTENGKVPYGIACLCNKYNKPVIAVCGMRSKDIGKMSELLLGAFSIQMGPVSLEEALHHDNALENLRITAKALVNLFLTRKDNQ